MNRLFVIMAFVSSLYVQAQTPTESEIRKDLDSRKDSLDNIEGIWEVTAIQQFYRYDTLYDVIKYDKGSRVGIVREGDHFRSYNLSGEPSDVQFSKSDIEGVYMYKNYFKDTDSYSKVNAVISKSGRMDFAYEFPEEYLRFKLLDSYEEGTRVINNTSWLRTYPDEKKAKK